MRFRRRCVKIGASRYRNHEFIPWDDDADIRVHPDDWAKMQHNLLTKALMSVEPGGADGEIRSFELKTPDGEARGIGATPLSSS